jgi:hypothetical protein
MLHSDSEARARCHGAMHHVGGNNTTPLALQKGTKFSFQRLLGYYFLVDLQ